MTPDEARKKREMDEAMTQFGDVFPAMWKTLYDGCKREGFTDTESMELVKTYILSQNPHGIRGSDA